MSDPKLKVSKPEPREISSERLSKSDKLAIVFFLLGIAVAIILFLVEKTPATVLSLLGLLAAALIYPILHFVKRSPGRIVAFFALVLIVFAFGRGAWPHKSTVPPSDSSKQIDELLEVLRNPTEQQKLLIQYPLGYTIFDVDAVTGAVTPEQARQGLKPYEFDYRTVQITENTATHVTIRLPVVLKNGKPLLTNAVISGDKNTMQLYGAGYGFSDGTDEISGTGQVLQYNGSRFTWIFGLRREVPLRPR